MTKPWAQGDAGRNMTIPGKARLRLVYRVLVVEFRLLRQCLFSTKVRASSISICYDDGKYQNMDAEMMRCALPELLFGESCMQITGIKIG